VENDELHADRIGSRKELYLGVGGRERELPR